MASAIPGTPSEALSVGTFSRPRKPTLSVACFPSELHAPESGRPMEIDWQSEGADFGRALEALTALLVAEEPLATVLDRVTALACEGIRDCDFASVTSMREEEFETVACSDPIALEIDQAQYADD